MTHIPKEYPEVVSTQNKMDHLISKLANLQKSYSNEVTTVLDNVRKNQYHGKVLQLCHDQGVPTTKWQGDGVGWKTTVVPCATRKADCAAPVVEFAGYRGSLQHTGDVLDGAANLNDAFNKCASETGCAGFTGEDELGPFQLYGRNGTYFDPPGWKENSATKALEPDSSLSNLRSVAFIKNGMVSATAGLKPWMVKSMGVPTKMTFMKYDNVRVLSQSDVSAYDEFAKVFPDKEGAAEEFAILPISRPFVSSPSAPLPVDKLNLALATADTNGTMSVLVGPDGSKNTAATLIAGAALLPARGWISYVPVKLVKSLAALGQIPTGTPVDTWVSGTDSAEVRLRCPATCSVECGNYYFVGADNVVRPIAKALGTCGKKAELIKTDMYQFLNDQGFKLSSDVIETADQCAINILDWPEKEQISQVLQELTALGDQIHARITTLKQEGADLARETGNAENEYNQVAEAYQAIYAKLRASKKASQTLDQMVTDFDLRSQAADQRYILWFCACVALVALIIHIARK